MKRFLSIFFCCTLFVGSNLFATDGIDTAQSTIDSLSNRVAYLEHQIEYLSMNNQFSTIKNDLGHYIYDSKILSLQLENMWQDVKYDSRKRDSQDRQILNSYQDYYESIRTAVNSEKELFMHAIFKDFLSRQKYKFEETETSVLDAQIASINSSFDLVQKCFAQIDVYLKELKRYH